MPETPLAGVLMSQPFFPSGSRAASKQGCIAPTERVPRRSYKVWAACNDVAPAVRCLTAVRYIANGEAVRASGLRAAGDRTITPARVSSARHFRQRSVDADRISSACCRRWTPIRPRAVVAGGVADTATARDQSLMPFVLEPDVELDRVERESTRPCCVRLGA